MWETSYEMIQKTKQESLTYLDVLRSSARYEQREASLIRDIRIACLRLQGLPLQ